MLDNTDLTIFHKEYDKETRLDIWTTTYVPKAWWHKAGKSTLDAEGIHQADVYTVRIPNTTLEVKKEDYLVKGTCDRKVSSPMELVGVEICKVTSVSYNLYGGNPHIKIGGV